jgi:arginine exporter protein ArgO
MVLGFVALIIPGIIIALMFSLVNPAIMLEGTSILGSLSRSRVLVSNRWLKTLGLFLVVGLIVSVVNGLAVLIGGQFGFVSPLISAILTAFITPIVPIATTLYYYSMKARTHPPPPPPPT